MSTDEFSPESEPQYTPPPPQPGFVDSWRHVVTDPRGFFASMPQAGGLHEPLVFLIVVAVINGLGQMVLGWGVSGAVAAVIWFVAGAFVSAAVLTLVSQHLFNGQAGFEPLFRVVAYASAPLALLWLPRLWVFALLYAWFLQVRGVERVNDFETTPAVLAVAVKTAVLLLIAASLRGWHL